MSWKCKCGGEVIEQLTTGHAVTDVIGFQLDGSAVCKNVTFIPHSFKPFVYRCKSCFVEVKQSEFLPTKLKTIQEVLNSEQTNDENPEG